MASPETDPHDVKRQMLQSTSIIGGATLAGLVIGLARTKVIAALLGPAGVGLMGLFNALQTMGAAIAGMGLDTSAVRQLSAAMDKPDDSLRVARWALWTLAWPLALGGGLVIWLFRDPLARLAIGDARYASWVGWVAIGVTLSVLGVVQLAAVQSFRRLGDLARIRVWAALLAAVVSIGAAWRFGAAGVVVAVVAAPAATAVVALWYGRKLPAWRPGRFPAVDVKREWRTLLGLGITVMTTAGIGSLTQTTIRAVLTQRSGLGAAGFFQASYAISTLNLGIVLGAMVPEYYPRLSAAADRPAEMQRLLNHQLHIGLILAAPLLLAISTAAPIVLSLLYTRDFTPASLLLRIQLAADALRVAGWALGFVLLARNARVSYVLLELVFFGVFVPLTWLFAPRYGVATVSAAYFIGYSIVVTLAMFLASRHGVRISRQNLLGIGALSIVLLGLAAVSHVSEPVAFGLGAVAVLGVSVVSLREVARIGYPALPAPVTRWLIRVPGLR